jgi:hypothetical protein
MTQNQENRLNRKENLLIFGNPDPDTNCYTSLNPGKDYLSISRVRASGLRTLFLMFCTVCRSRSHSRPLTRRDRELFAHAGTVNE